MQTGIVTTIPPAAPLQSPATNTQANPASGLPVFAQMVAQNVAATNSGQSNDANASNAPKAASSITTVNSSPHPSGNKIAPKSASAPGSIRGNGLLDLLAQGIPTLSPILPQPISAEVGAPAVNTPAVANGGVLAAAAQPAVGTGPNSSETPNTANLPTYGTIPESYAPSVTPNAPASGAAIKRLAPDSATPVQNNQNSSGLGDTPTATSAGNDLAAIVTTLEGGNALGTPPTEPSTATVTQGVDANQTSAVSSEPQASGPPSLGHTTSNTASSATPPFTQDVAVSQTYAGYSETQAPTSVSQGHTTSNTTSPATPPVTQDVAASQTPTTSSDPQAPGFMNQANLASDAANLPNPPVIQSAAAKQTPLPTMVPKAPAPANQDAAAAKAASLALEASHAKTGAAPSVKNSPAAIQPQLPTVGDVLRQVAAVTGKANALAAQISIKSTKDSVSGPVKGAPVDLAEAAMTDLQSTASRSTPVASQQAGVNASSMSKGNGAGSTTTGDPHEQENTAAPASVAKGNDSTPSVNFSDAQPVAHPSAADGSSNPQATGATPATPAVVKDDTPVQKTTAPDPARSDATMNPAMDKPGLDAGTSRVISSAQLSGNGAHSEMHIAMQTDKLGAVELHARVTGEQVGAAITVEKKEAHAALAAELPTLQQALAEKNLRVAHVVLLQGVLHSTAGGAGDPTERQPRSQPGMAYQQQQAGAPLPPIFAAATEPNGIFDDRGRLNVQA